MFSNGLSGYGVSGPAATEAGPGAAELPDEEGARGEAWVESLTAAEVLTFPRSATEAWPGAAELPDEEGARGEAWVESLTAAEVLTFPRSATEAGPGTAELPEEEGERGEAWVESLTAAVLPFSRPDGMPLPRPANKKEGPPPSLLPELPQLSPQCRSTAPCRPATRRRPAALRLLAREVGEEEGDDGGREAAAKILLAVAPEGEALVLALTPALVPGLGRNSLQK